MRLVTHFKHKFGCLKIQLLFSKDKQRLRISNLLYFINFLNFQTSLHTPLLTFHRPVITIHYRSSCAPNFFSSHLLGLYLCHNKINIQRPQIQT